MHTIQRVGKEWHVGFELKAPQGLRNFRHIATLNDFTAAWCLCSLLNGGSDEAIPFIASRMVRPND